MVLRRSDRSPADRPLPRKGWVRALAQIFGTAQDDNISLLPFGTGVEARFECQRGRSKEAAQDSKLRNLQSEDLCVVDRSVPPDIQDRDSHVISKFSAF
jgi:hypothetical protein